MRQEGSYGNSHTDTDVESQSNLHATDPDWLIENDPNLSELTDEEYEKFQRAVSGELTEEELEKVRALRASGK